MRNRGRVPECLVEGQCHGFVVPNRRASNYCRRYRPVARMAQPVDTSTSHVGFRRVVREDREE